MSDRSNRYQNVLMNFIRLIMSRGSKETLQVEAMKFLSSDTIFFGEFICATMGKSNNDVNDAHKNIMVTDTEQSHSEKSKMKEDVKRTHTGTIERTKRVSKTGRKSKYEGIDFSHIHREPKTSKRKRNTYTKEVTHHQDQNYLPSSEMNDSSKHFRVEEDENNLDFIRSIFQMLFDTTSKGGKSGDLGLGAEGNFRRNQLYTENEGKSTERDEKIDVSLEKDEECSIKDGKTTLSHVQGNDERNVIASTLMYKLVHSKSKEEQEKVLKSLRADESLRNLFLKEASSQKGLRIPVFHASKANDIEDKGHGQSYSHCKCDQKSKEDFPIDLTPTPALGTTDQTMVNETQMGGPASHTAANENIQLGIAITPVITTPSQFWQQDESIGRNDSSVKTNTAFTDGRSVPLQTVCYLDPYMPMIDANRSGDDENTMVEFYKDLGSSSNDKECIDDMYVEI